jgi:hypothetical protein
MLVVRRPPKIEAVPCLKRSLVEAMAKENIYLSLFSKELLHADWACVVLCMEQ